MAFGNMKWLLIFLVMTHLIARIKKTPSTMHYGLCTLYATPDGASRNCIYLCSDSVVALEELIVSAIVLASNIYTEDAK